ncbi:MAG: PEP-CTERM sorting domain-containing protein [Pirellulales bacterium]
MKRQRVSFHSAPFVGCAMAALLCLAVCVPANAAVIFSDDFNSSVDFASGALGTWSTSYNLPALAGGVMNSNTSNAGKLTIEDNYANVQGNNTGGTPPGVANHGWEGNRSTSPVIFKQISGGYNNLNPYTIANGNSGGYDWRVTVKLEAQANGNWSHAGIIARAPSATAPGYCVSTTGTGTSCNNVVQGSAGNDHADENFINFTHVYRNDGNGVDPATNPFLSHTSVRRVHRNSANTNLVNNENAPIAAVNQELQGLWLRLVRVNDTVVPGRKRYIGYMTREEDGGGNPINWVLQGQQVTLDTAPNPDDTMVGNILNNGLVPTEIGLSFMTFTEGNADLRAIGTAVFENFTIEAIPEPTSVVMALLACCGLAGFRRRR